MSASSSQFYSNLIKIFTAKVTGNVVYADDLNEVTDEVEAIEQILGTGLRSRTVVSWASSDTSWSTLTSRLNNMEAGIRSTDPAVHAQYATISGASLQPSTTSIIGLTVTGRSGSLQPLAKFISQDGTTVALQVNNSTVSALSSTITGTLTVVSTSSVSITVNADTAYTGNVLEIFKGASKTAYLTATGAASLSSLIISGTLTLTDFTNATHDHTSTAQGGRIFPAGTVTMWAGGGTSVPTGWLLCDGTAVSRATYSALFTAIGTAYGAGDGSTTFNLPSMTSRFPRGSSTTAPGTSGGVDSVTLTTSNMPAHTHLIDHNHGSFTSGSTSISPSLNMTTRKQSGSTLSGTDIKYITDGTGSGELGTPLDVNSFSHTHSIDPPAYSGTSGSNGSGASVAVTNPYVTVHFIVKV